MFNYKVRMGNGAILKVRAKSPKEAWEIAEKIGVVAGVFFRR